jgi:hypothetical protein
MRLSSRILRAAACALALASLGAAAQTSDDRTVDPAVASKQASEIARGDPSRWYRNDPTRQARMRTLQKEIGAALNEARNGCRQGATAERGACMQEAQATWKQDMAAARAQLDAAPEGAVQEQRR